MYCVEKKKKNYIDFLHNLNFIDHILLLCTQCGGTIQFLEYNMQYFFIMVECVQHPKNMQVEQSI
jgi:hypothetical protein